METIEPVIESTADGSQTLRHPFLHDTYHSLRGAEGESRYIFIEQGLQEWIRRRTSEVEGTENISSVAESSVAVSTDLGIRIFEVGFGSGLNAWLTLQEACRRRVPVYYETVELYPVSETVAVRLAYASDSRFMALHRAPWEVAVPVDEWFTLKKRYAALADCRFDLTFDLVYFDAFAPDTQPELWSREVFARLYESMNSGGLLVTYSAKGTVKENLRAAGFRLKRLPGALGKHHMLRAEKP